MSALGIKRNVDETWRDCAIRYARTYGLEMEVAESFDAHIRAGVSEEDAALGACLDWDVADLVPARNLDEYIGE